MVKNKCDSCEKEGTCGLQEDYKFILVCALHEKKNINCEGGVKIYDNVEPKFLLDQDSICFGCKYFDGKENCRTPQLCIEGSMNGYRMEG